MTATEPQRKIGRRKVNDPCRKLAKGIVAGCHRDGRRLIAAYGQFKESLDQMRVWGNWAKGTTCGAIELPEVAELLGQDEAELQMSLFKPLGCVLAGVVLGRVDCCPVCGSRVHDED